MENIMLLILPFGVTIMSWPLARYVGVRNGDVMDYPDY